MTHGPAVFSKERLEHLKSPGIDSACRQGDTIGATRLAIMTAVTKPAPAA
jgi:hypothetical protein